MLLCIANKLIKKKFNFIKDSDIDSIYANLSVIPNYQVYKKSQIPDEYHYKSNVRVGGKLAYDLEIHLNVIFIRHVL